MPIKHTTTFVDPSTTQSGTLINAAKLNADHAVTDSDGNPAAGIFRWKDTPDTALEVVGATSNVAWTTLDLTPYTSTTATVAYVLLFLCPTTIDSGDISQLSVRKTGTTGASYWPLLQLDKLGITNAYSKFLPVICALNATGHLDYKVDVGTGWTLNYGIYVLGYME